MIHSKPVEFRGSYLDDLRAALFPKENTKNHQG